MDAEAEASRFEGLSDEELWARFVAGEDDAFEALRSRYQDALYWYLLLSTGRQDAAMAHLRTLWATLAAWRQRFEGFDSFKAWLYAAATQNCVPATHPEPFGLGELIDDIKRGSPTSERARAFFALRDMTRQVRQPFLLVSVAGLSIQQAAKACNFTVERALAAVEQGFRMLARDGLFSVHGAEHEV